MKRVKLYRMIDIVGQLSPTLPSFWNDMEYTEDGTTVKVMTAQNLVNHLGQVYPTFRFYDTAAYTVDPYPITTAAYNLGLKWNTFITDHPEFVYIAQMLNRRDYDPLENYDRKEDGGWKDTTDDDATHKMKYAKNTTETKNDPKIKTKTTGSVYGDNSTTAVPDTESITEPVRDSATDVDTITTENKEHTDESWVEGDMVLTRLFQDYRVHGNIGVTTAAQMIEGEAKVRLKLNLEKMILREFAAFALTLTEEVIA